MRPLPLARAAPAFALTLLAVAPGLHGQEATVPPDTLHLGDLQARALRLDARSGQAGLHRRSTELRVSNLATERLPRTLLRGDAAHQSETAALPLAGAGIAPPPRDRYEAALEAEWLVWDGGATRARREAEEARLAATLAGVDAELHEIRMEVTDAFFTLLALQEQLSENELLGRDLGARLRELRDRVRNGAALPGDTAVLAAEILQVEQAGDALEAHRRSVRSVLGHLTGVAVEDAQVLVLPRLDSLVGETRRLLEQGTGGGTPPASLPEALRVHPGLRALSAERAARGEQMDVLSAARRPTVAAFGSLAWGSPGYRQFVDDPHEYWRAGLRVQWQPWEWGRTDRERELVRVEERLLETRERALADRLLRAVRSPLDRITMLEEALRTDSRIIALREEAEAVARARFAERDIPASTYTEARNHVQQARIRRALHEIERVRAQARLLVTLGFHLPAS